MAKKEEAKKIEKKIIVSPEKQEVKKDNGQSQQSVQSPTSLPENPSLVAKLKSESPTQGAEGEKRGRGRPTGSTTRKAEPVEPITVALPTMADPAITSGVFLLLNTLAGKVCPDMPITPQEAETVALPVTQAKTILLPNMTPIQIICINGAIATIGVFLPRIIRAVQLNEEKKQTPPHVATTLPADAVQPQATA